jgi:hypothetical protein
LGGVDVRGATPALGRACAGLCGASPLTSALVFLQTLQFSQSGMDGAPKRFRLLVQSVDAPDPCSRFEAFQAGIQGALIEGRAGLGEVVAGELALAVGLELSLGVAQGGGGAGMLG